MKIRNIWRAGSAGLISSGVWEYSCFPLFIISGRWKGAEGTGFTFSAIWGRLSCIHVARFCRLLHGSVNVTQILFIPAVLVKIEDKRQRRFWSIAVGLAAAGYFVLYLLRAGNDGIRVLPYQTFMFHDMVPILSDVN